MDYVCGNVTKMSLTSTGCDYFAALISGDTQSHSALERLVDDLHSDKDFTVTSFLGHSGSEDFLWGLVRLVANGNSRVAGNAAYIIGSLAESELGCFRVLSLARARNEEGKKMLHNLTTMLTFNDPESVMNAAGTLGTLAESHEGREWILSESCLGEMIERITELLQNSNLWTASNAALVLARLSISEEGCSRIVNHREWQMVLSKLIISLGVDEAGRGMNAAFAVGRLCDTELGRSRLLALPESEKMISSLSKMLCSQDTGVSKNACFALSCLAASTQGHSRLLGNCYIDTVLQQLSDRLLADDRETGWFAAMTLRTLACQPKGCLKLRSRSFVLSALKRVENDTEQNSDIREEVLVTLEILKRLGKPSPPRLQVQDKNTLEVEWDKVETKSGLEVTYQLYEEETCVYAGAETSCRIDKVKPLTEYKYKLRTSTEGDTSPFSDPVTITTEESVPGPPTNPRIVGCTATQLKLAWDPPDEPNGVLKGYYVYIGQNLVEFTHEQMAIITGLQAFTVYEAEICTATSKGKGPRVSVTGQTAEIGAHAPCRPEVTVMGRNEINVSWKPPEVPLGRITRYDLTMNGKPIYSGTGLSCGARRLTPDTEYTFVVTALTNEGRFESKPTRKRTSKDEYDVCRAPLYQPPVRKEEEPVKPLPSELKKRKSLTGNTETKLHVPLRTISASSRKHVSNVLQVLNRPKYKKAKTIGELSPIHETTELYEKTADTTKYKLCRAWTKIDLNTTKEYVKRDSRTSPTDSGNKDQSHKQDKDSWHIDDSYPPVQMNKGSKSLVGSESSKKDRSALGIGRRRNSDCFPKGPVQRDSSKSINNKDAHAWSKPVFPLGLNSMSQMSENDNTRGQYNTDTILGLTAAIAAKAEKHQQLLNKDLDRRYGIKLRPLNRRDKFSGKDPHHVPVLTPTWAPSMEVTNQNAPRMHNKFVPMQFRTQPSNLSIDRIERMNTQVLETRGFGGMNLKCVQGIARSHTHADLRSTDHSLSTTQLKNLRNRQHKLPLNSQSVRDLNSIPSHPATEHTCAETRPINVT